MSYSTAIVLAATLIAGAIMWTSQPARTQTDARPGFMIVADARPGFVWRLDVPNGEMFYCEASAIGGCSKLVP